MKKILLVSHRGYMDGGAMLAFSNVITYLKERYQVTVLIPCKGDFSEWLEKNKIEYIILKSHPCVVDRSISIKGKAKFMINGLSDYLEVLRHKNRFSDYDLIYTNTRATLIGCYLSKLLHVPHVLHCREMISIGNDWLTLPWTAKMLNNYTNKVLVISKAMLNNTKDIDKEKMKLIYDGVSYKGELDCISDFTNKSKFRIMMAGSVTPAKNQMDIICAVGQLKKRNIQVDLIVAGQISSSYQKYYNKLQNQIKKDDIEGSVKFLGVVKDMKSLRKTVDFEVMCSKFEAFGRVTVEALRSGKLFIGANTGATSEIVEDGITGYVYPVGNYKKLADIIEYCINNSEKSNQICNNAYEILNKKFKNEQMLAGIENVIKQEI